MDFYQDLHGSTLRLIGQIKELPRFVKNAKVIDKNSIPFEKFAYPSEHSFSCADPASTYLSFAYYCMNKDKVPVGVRTGILKHAAFYEILDEIKDFTNRFVAVKKHFDKKAEKGTYGLPKSKGYPLFTKEQVHIAQDHFDTNYQNYGIDDRVKIAETIQKRASDYGMNVRSRQVTIYANNAHNICRPDQAAVMIAGRGYELAKQANLTESEALKTRKAFVKIAQSLYGNAVHVDYRYRVIPVLERIEKLASAHCSFDYFSAIHNLPIKTAQAMIEYVNLDGDHYSLDDLASIPPDVYAEAMGDDFVGEISNTEGSIDKNLVFDIIPTLPMDDKQILKQFVDQHLAGKMEI
jgi:hypothetical protein